MSPEKITDVYWNCNSLDVCWSFLPVLRRCAAVRACSCSWADVHAVVSCSCNKVCTDLTSSSSLQISPHLCPCLMTSGCPLWRPPAGWTTSGTSAWRRRSATETPKFTGIWCLSRDVTPPVCRSCLRKASEVACLLRSGHLTVALQGGSRDAGPWLVFFIYYSHGLPLINAAEESLHAHSQDTFIQRAPLLLLHMRHKHTPFTDLLFKLASNLPGSHIAKETFHIWS